MKFLKYQDFLLEGVGSILQRISTEEPFSVLDMDDYIDRLKVERSAKTVGGGASAEILETPSREIIKVFSPNNDPAMTRFLSFIATNPKNSLVPRIDEIRRVRATEEDRWIISVKMENLRPITKDIEREIDDFLNDPKWNGLKDVYGNSKARGKFFDEFTEMISKYTSAGKKEISDLMSFLKGHVEKYPEGIDFGSKNWMLRGRDIVMIDPFWPGYSKD